MSGATDIVATSVLLGVNAVVLAMAAFAYQRSAAQKRKRQPAIFLCHGAKYHKTFSPFSKSLPEARVKQSLAFLRAIESRTET